MPVIFMAACAAVLINEPSAAKWVLGAYAMLVLGRVLGMLR